MKARINIAEFKRKYAEAAHDATELEMDVTPVNAEFFDPHHVHQIAE